MSFWIWIPKNSKDFGKGFIATEEQVRRGGWRARKVRVQPPPPPLRQSFASAVRFGEMNRDLEQGASKRGAGDGGYKRGYEGDNVRGRGDQDFEQEARRGGRGFRGYGEEDDLRFELDMKDRVSRSKQQHQYGGDRFGRDEDQGKRRMIEERGANYGHLKMEENRLTGNNSELNTFERMGRGRPVQFGRGSGVGGGRGSRVGGGRGVLRPEDRGICFRCGQEGHHQSTCRNEPYCYKCKNNGHISASCPENKGVSLHMYGFGIQG